MIRTRYAPALQERRPRADEHAMTWVLILAVLVGVVGIFLAILDEGSNARFRARSGS